MILQIVECRALKLEMISPGNIERSVGRTKGWSEGKPMPGLFWSSKSDRIHWFSKVVCTIWLRVISSGCWAPLEISFSARWVLFCFILLQMLEDKIVFVPKANGIIAERPPVYCRGTKKPFVSLYHYPFQLLTSRENLACH